MSSMDLLDVGQANEFKLACRRNGFTPEDLKQLCEGDVLAQFRKVLLGHAAITVPKHIINTNAAPFVPDGWSVEQHQTTGPRNTGLLEWDGSKVQLYLDTGQQNGKYIRGNQLRELLVGKPVLNANVLDYLLNHLQLIPEEWKGKAVFFWGTIYRLRDGDLYVRYLYWGGGRWRWDFGWLGGDFDGDPAALLAS